MGRGMRRLAVVLWAAALVSISDPPVASACGCLSPPAVTSGRLRRQPGGRADRVRGRARLGDRARAHPLRRRSGAVRVDRAGAGGARARRVADLGVRPARSGDRARSQVTIEDICPHSTWALPLRPADRTWRLRRRGEGRCRRTSAPDAGAFGASRCRQRARRR